MRFGRAFTRSRLSRGTIALALAGAVALPGCGGGSSGNPIPQAEAARMLALIQLADQNASDGKCGGADAKVREAQSVASSLPRSVKKDVRNALNDGLDRMRSLISSQCRRPTPTNTQTTPTQTQTTVTETTPTTTPTTTTPSTTTPTTTTPSTTTPTTTTQTTTTGNGGAGVGTGTGAANGGGGQ